MGWNLPFAQASIWPGVARPNLSPNPNEGSNPSRTGCGNEACDFFM
jgi:hypothetical protein